MNTKRKKMKKMTHLSIDKLYTQIIKVFRLYLRVEPFAVMFWALGNVLTRILKQ